jgi:hypothetical protein
MERGRERERERKTHLDLGLIPPKDAGEQGEGEALQAREQVLGPGLPEDLQIASAGPGIDGQLDDPLLDIDEAGLDVPLLQEMGDGQRALGLVGCLVHVLGPLLVGPVVGHGPVVAAGFVHDILALHVAAGLGVAEAAVDDGAEVGEGAHKHARMDVVVVVLGDGPVLLLGIVDDEVDVVGDVGGLDGGEVGGLDDGVGVGVGHLDRPGASAGADVEDVAGFDEGREVQDALQGVVEDTVEVIEALGFSGIVGVVVD